MAKKIMKTLEKNKIKIFNFIFSCMFLINLGH